MQSLKNALYGKEIDKLFTKNYSKNIALVTGFLIGVDNSYLTIISDGEYTTLLNKLTTDENANAIRTFNRLRTQIMLDFKDIRSKINIESNGYTAFDKIDKIKEYYSELRKYDFCKIPERNDLFGFLKTINDEILRRIDFVKPYYPGWINFSHIRFFFDMGSNIKHEVHKFQCNKNCYPYSKYFNWAAPQSIGNILKDDRCILKIIYENKNEIFTDYMLIDAEGIGQTVTINKFLSAAGKAVAVVDGENNSPGSLANAIESLNDNELAKIDKIVIIYDEDYSTKEWEHFQNYARGVTVKNVPAKRVLANKSLVDLKVATTIMNEISEGADSIVLISSDSDFWSVIEDTGSTRFLVMAEKLKTSDDYIYALQRKGIPCCFIDSIEGSAGDKLIEEAVLAQTLDIFNVYLKAGNCDKVFESIFSSMNIYIDKETVKEKLMANVLNRVKISAENNQFVFSATV